MGTWGRNDVSNSSGSRGIRLLPAMLRYTVGAHMGFRIDFLEDGLVRPVSAPVVSRHAMNMNDLGGFSVLYARTDVAAE